MGVASGGPFGGAKRITTDITWKESVLERNVALTPLEFSRLDL